MSAEEIIAWMQEEAHRSHQVVLTDAQANAVADAYKELRAKRDQLAGDFCCIHCADGHTPLYCLNCAETMLARNLMR